MQNNNYKLEQTQHLETVINNPDYIKRVYKCYLYATISSDEYYNSQYTFAPKYDLEKPSIITPIEMINKNTILCNITKYNDTNIYTTYIHSDNSVKNPNYMD